MQHDRPPCSVGRTSALGGKAPMIKICRRKAQGSHCESNGPSRKARSPAAPKTTAKPKHAAAQRARCSLAPAKEKGEEARGGGREPRAHSANKHVRKDTGERAAPTVAAGGALRSTGPSHYRKPDPLLLFQTKPIITIRYCGLRVQDHGCIFLARQLGCVHEIKCTRRA